MEREYELDQAETISLLSALTLTVSTFWNIKIQTQQMGKCILANGIPRVGWNLLIEKIWSENYYETSLVIIRTRFWNTIWFENKTLRVGDKGRGNGIRLEIWLELSSVLPAFRVVFMRNWGLGDHVLVVIGLGTNLWLTVKFTHLYFIPKSWQRIFCCRRHIWFLF